MSNETELEVGHQLPQTRAVRLKLDHSVQSVFINIKNFQIKTNQHQAWWHLPIITALRTGRQEAQEFKVIFSNIMALNKTLSQKNQKREGECLQPQHWGGRSRRIRSLKIALDIEKN